MKDFLAISDYSSDEIQDLLDLAVKLKKQYFKKGNKPIFKGFVDSHRYLQAELKETQELFAALGLGASL